MRKGVLILMLVGMLSCVREDFSEAKGAQSTIVFLGDSLTEGMMLPRWAAYPALIEKRLKEERFPFQAINAGVSGDTAAEGLGRSSKVLNTRVGILVLAFGANDLPRGVPADQCEANLQKIIDRARELNVGVKIVIAGVDLPQQRRFEGWGAYQEMYRRIAERNSAVFIPNILQGVAGRDDLNFPDGLHPNTEGHRVIADTMWGALLPLLTKSSPFH